MLTGSARKLSKNDQKFVQDSGAEFLVQVLVALAPHI